MKLRDISTAVSSRSFLPTQARAGGLATPKNEKFLVSERAPENTIAYEIAQMVVGFDDATGRLAAESCSGAIWWIDAEYAATFLKDYGSTLPDSYRKLVGSEWQADFLTMSWRAFWREPSEG